MTEVEQVERLKQWWHDYGTSAIIGIIIAIVGGFGWHYWQQHRENQLLEASVQYEQLLTSIVNGEAGDAENRANNLIDQYPRTPYAQLAALQLARQDVYQNKLADAESKLQWLIKHGDNSALRAVARIRAARVLVAEKQPEKALELLEKNNNKAYISAIEETKGDILVSMGKKQEALQAYQIAQKAFPGLEVMQPLLQMKIDNLDTVETLKTTTKTETKA